MTFAELAELAADPCGAVARRRTSIVNLPSFTTIEEANHYAAERYGAARVTLYRGIDGLIRGTAIVEVTP